MQFVFFLLASLLLHFKETEASTYTDPLRSCFLSPIAARSRQPPKQTVPPKDSSQAAFEIELKPSQVLVLDNFHGLEPYFRHIVRLDPKGSKCLNNVLNRHKLKFQTTGWMHEMGSLDRLIELGSLFLIEDIQNQLTIQSPLIAIFSVSLIFSILTTPGKQAYRDLFNKETADESLTGNGPGSSFYFNELLFKVDPLQKTVRLGLSFQF